MSRGMVSPVVFWNFCVGINAVLHTHILELKVRPRLFHSPTLVLYKCTNFLPSLWLPCIYLLVLIYGTGHAILPNILPQSHLLPR